MIRRLPRIHRSMCLGLGLGIPFDWPVAAAPDPLAPVLDAPDLVAFWDYRESELISSHVVGEQTLVSDWEDVASGLVFSQASEPDQYQLTAAAIRSDNGGEDMALASPMALGTAYSIYLVGEIADTGQFLRDASGSYLRAAQVHLGSTNFTATGWASGGAGVYEVASLVRDGATMQAQSNLGTPKVWDTTSEAATTFSPDRAIGANYKGLAVYSSAHDAETAAGVIAALMESFGIS